MADGWLPGWTRVDNPRAGGGTYATDYFDYKPKIVLHTIEGRGFGNVAGHPYPPHLWYNPATREKVQTVPLDRSAFALYQPGDSVHYTNKARVLQVELVGYAAEAAGWPDEWLRNIAVDVVAPLCQWVAIHWGQRVDLGDVPEPGAIPGSASEHAPQRFSDDAWGVFGGLCSHRHVPYNDHWDTGGLDLRRVAAYAAELLGGEVPVQEVVVKYVGKRWFAFGVGAGEAFYKVWNNGDGGGFDPGVDKWRPIGKPQDDAVLVKVDVNVDGDFVNLVVVDALSRPWWRSMHIPTGEWGPWHYLGSFMLDVATATQYAVE